MSWNGRIHSSINDGSDQNLHMGSLPFYYERDILYVLVCALLMYSIASYDCVCILVNVFTCVCLCITESMWACFAVDQRASQGLSTSCAIPAATLESLLNSTRSLSAETLVTSSTREYQRHQLPSVTGYITCHPLLIEHFPGMNTVPGLNTT